MVISVVKISVIYRAPAGRGLEKWANYKPMYHLQGTVQSETSMFGEWRNPVSPQLKPVH